MITRQTVHNSWQREMRWISLYCLGMEIAVIACGLGLVGLIGYALYRSLAYAPLWLVNR